MSAPKQPEVAISVKGLHKDFKLPHQKTGTVKNAFTNILSMHKTSYETQHALKDINFEIKKGEFFGVVGRNGSGKSTLLKILAGIYRPTKGTVVTNGRVVPFIELGVGFNSELSGRDNVYLNGALLGFSQKEIDARYMEIVDFAELDRFMDQKLKNYSSGMQVRLAFSIATKLAESDILLIDEVLAVGDADFQRKCFQYFKGLKRQKKTVVFVSHDMSAVREYCDRAALIESSKVVVVDKANVVALAYNKMFIEEQEGTDESDATNRWGDDVMKYVKLQVPKKITDEDNTLNITARVRAKDAVTSAVFGFDIKAADGRTLMGSNSQLADNKMYDLKKGEELEISWQMPNIFEDGDYYVSIAAVHDGSVSDWWSDCAVFRSLRASKTPFTVSPRLVLNVQKAKGVHE